MTHLTISLYQLVTFELWLLFPASLPIATSHDVPTAKDAWRFELFVCACTREQRQLITLFSPASRNSRAYRIRPRREFSFPKTILARNCSSIRGRSGIVESFVEMHQKLHFSFSAAMAMHGSVVFCLSATSTPFFYSHVWLLEALIFLGISPNLALHNDYRQFGNYPKINLLNFENTARELLLSTLRA